MAITFVLIAFVANDVPSMWIWRPMAISVVVAISIQSLFWKALGPHRGLVWAFVAFTAVAGMFILAGATVLVLTMFSIVSSRPGREYELVGRLAGLLSLLYLAL